MTKKMIVQTDFTTKRHTLVFQDRRIQLTDLESREFERWFEGKKAETD